jgi:hypothetical protein
MRGAEILSGNVVKKSVMNTGNISYGQHDGNEEYHRRYLPLIMDDPSIGISSSLVHR